MYYIRWVMTHSTNDLAKNGEVLSDFHTIVIRRVNGITKNLKYERERVQTRTNRKVYNIKRSRNY